MRIAQGIILGILATVLAACGATATPIPIFEGVVVPTRQPTPTPNPTAAIEGAGAVFPVVEGELISLGQPITGEINNERYAVIYTLEAQAGQILDIMLNGRNGDLDPFLILIGPDGREIARNDDRSDTSLNAALRGIELPATGRYSVVATRWRQRYGFHNGSYTLEAREGSADNATRPTRLTSYGVTQRSEISDESFADTYTFAGAAGDIVDITMFALDDNDGVDASLLLTDSMGNDIAGNEDINPIDTFDAAITDFVLPYSGYYTVIASRYKQADGASVGDYELTVTQVGQTDQPPIQAYLDPNQSLTLMGNEAGVLDFGLFVGDIEDGGEPDIPAQSILVYYFPPLTGEIATATLTIRCDQLGGGFDAIEAINIYAELLNERIDNLTSYQPNEQAERIATVTACEDIDITEAVRTAYTNDPASLQLRLMPQITQANEREESVVILEARLEITTQ